MLRVCLLLLVLAAVTVQAANLVVQTDKGAIQGFVNEKRGVDIWRGIPYAAPPVGPFRFRPPQPSQAWSGVRSGFFAGNICPQLKNLTGADKWTGAEDCLYLDVYAPSNRTSNKPLPVFVWLYGGGWTFGDGLEFGMYEGSKRASRENVIMVQPNYRLGPLGFLSLPAFQREDPSGSVGSYGVYDQVAVLKWVQRNIAAFGGDPNQVTIAGESAGAFSSCIHMVSPLSRGLFKNAILESGTCSSTIFYQKPANAFAWGATFTRHAGCDPSKSDAEVLQCMRSLDLNKVMGPPMDASWEGYKPLMFPALNWGSTIDGVLFSDVPIKLMQTGKFNPVDSIIMGSNLDEGTIFVPRLPKVIPQLHWPLENGDLDLILNHFFGNNATTNALVHKYYPRENFPSINKQAERMLRDFFFVCPSSRAMLSLNTWGVNTYLYQFTYQNKWIEVKDMGCYHSYEVFFVFANEWPPIIHAYSPDDETMADTFGWYWFNTVRTGNPNGNGGSSSPFPVWPKYEPFSMSSMQLSVPSKVVNKLEEDKCQIWDAIGQYTPAVQEKMAEMFAAIQLQ